MKKGQFSRDWSLLKLARTWEPRDIGGEVVERVLREGSPEAVADILDVIGTIGFEDGEKAKERMPSLMQPVEIIESTLLVAGVETERLDGEERPTIMINLEAHDLFGYPFSMTEPAVAYITGFVQAVSGGAAVSQSEDHLLIRF
ncbi:hypothetical protein [Methanogenium organophilum]|uniref:Uncharacterized protein n=1 Tax=Methanogenium organophilum TaxID=2199 RepID=A0A9X9S3D1_METOG|nr:hypothetical protein [Methanogenium organophilum]WAI01159.1 hypothetical protein OU421_12195 [Methanogenium organophilum]